MKNQTLYRGGENKKEKPTKVEKVFNAMQKYRKAQARTKKEATS